MKIIDYDILTTDQNKNVLTAKVKEQMSVGWQPFGAPFAYGGELLQAMIREEPK